MNEQYQQYDFIFLCQSGCNCFGWSFLSWDDRKETGGYIGQKGGEDEERTMKNEQID